MNIKVLQLIEGAKRARGLAVIIDVFRAFTTECYVMANGAEKIIPVGDIEAAYKLKEDNPDYFLIGERKCRMLPGFDYGNSPSQIEEVNFTGKTVIHTTSAGTQGIVNAIYADEIITGSFVNAKAVAEYIMRKNPTELSFVCMGLEGITSAYEDVFCAMYIKSILTNKRFELEPIVEKLKKTTGKKFFEPENQEWGPKRDFYLCLQPNRFDFVLKVERQEAGNLYLRKINIK